MSSPYKKMIIWLMVWLMFIIIIAFIWAFAEVILYGTSQQSIVDSIATVYIASILADKLIV